MAQRDVAFAVQAMGGELLSGSPETVWNGLDFDTRRPQKGKIFFALAGETVDGHDFLARAVLAGAVALVVSQDLRRRVQAAGVAWIQVEDTYTALHDLTRALRREVPKHVVGITGSAGKTTTKELLGAMLERRFRVAKSPGNFNNLFGFPLSLSSIDDDTDWMVAEMGMSTPGELRQVSLLGRPDVAVFTNVRPVHLENFADLRGITEAKAELLAGLAEGGLVVANADDPEVMHIVEHHVPDGSRVVRYGFEKPADVQGRELRPVGGDRPGSRFQMQVTADDGSLATQWVELPIHGLYNAENCLAAAAASYALGVPLAEIAAAMDSFTSSQMRGEVHRLGKGFVLVDDSYNSNPDAAVKALESARHLDAERYWAVLGDMLELGPESPRFHRQVGERAAELNFRVLGVGPQSVDLVDGVKRRGGHGIHVPDAAAAAAWVTRAAVTDTAAVNDMDDVLKEGDLMLVKGSRGVGLEAVTQALTRALAKTSLEGDAT